MKICNSTLFTHGTKVICKHSKMKRVARPKNT